MFVKRALCAFVLLVLPARAWALPCGTPSVFSNAAVNVVVLPFSLPPSLRGSAEAGAQLTAMVQLETLLAIAKYGSIAVTQLVGDASNECAPDIVLDKLLGRQSGARETMRQGSGLILIWGRIFESGSDLYLQSFVQFLRAGTAESVDVAVRDRTLKGTLSTQAFACAPRKIALKDLQDIQRRFRSARLLHGEPTSRSRSVEIPATKAPLAFWVTDLRGDWVQVEPMDRGSDQKFERGWLQVRPDAQWSLRAKMPELYFVEGVAGYLMARVRSNSPAIVDAALLGADAAIARYTDAWGVNAVLGNDATTNGTPLAVAVPRQLRGFIALLRSRGSDSGLVEARAQFERAAALAAHSSDARNLLTITQVAQTFRQPATATHTPRRFVDDVRALLGSDPSNATVLANLAMIYDLVLTNVPGAPASWTLTAAERDQLTRQRESLRTLKSS